MMCHMNLLSITHATSSGFRRGWRLLPPSEIWTPSPLKGYSLPFYHFIFRPTLELSKNAFGGNVYKVGEESSKYQFGRQKIRDISKNCLENFYVRDVLKHVFFNCKPESNLLDKGEAELRTNCHTAPQT